MHFMTAMENALLQIGGERFELECPDQTGDYTAVILLPKDGSAVLFESSADGDSQRIRTFKLTDAYDDIDSLVSALDLLWASPAQLPGIKSWVESSTHVALVVRLVEFAPDANFVPEAKEALHMR